MTLLPVLLALLLFGAAPNPSGGQIQELLRARTGTVRLPAGTFEISAELRIPDGAHDLDIAGSGTTLLASGQFHGRAMLSCRNCRAVHIRNLSIDGNRKKLERPVDIPPSNATFAATYPNNGLLLEGGGGLSVSGLHLREMPSFAVLVSAARDVTIEDVTVESSGGHNSLHRNNTSGGILLEEGVVDWRVTRCHFQGIAGNAVWTHSRYGSPRNTNGLIAGNTFDTIGRDAIQVGHATGVQVKENHGRRIGWPVSEIDVEARAVPVAIDTAGNVDRSRYEGNHFEEIDGKCVDLDGFHDGAVVNNSCVSRGRAEDYAWGQYGIVMNDSAIDMQPRNVTIEGNEIDGARYGGIFVIGESNRILRNRLLHLNLARCEESKAGCAVAGSPELLSAGIYLGSGGARPAPARGNRVEGNVVRGWKMSAHCVAYGAGVRREENTVGNNMCADE